MLGRCLVVGLLLGVLSGAPHAVERVDFDLETTADLIDLCSVGRNDPLSVQAIHFCVGYIEGAMDYHDAVLGADMKPLVCRPDGTTRNDAVGVVAAWGAANRGNAGLMNEQPVVGVVRALASEWPCAGRPATR